MAGEIDPVCVVDDAIEDGVGVGGSPINSCHLSMGIWLMLHTAERPLDPGIAAIAAGEREVGE
jgi:hypothetical protein